MFLEMENKLKNFIYIYNLIEGVINFLVNFEYSKDLIGHKYHIKENLNSNDYIRLELTFIEYSYYEYYMNVKYDNSKCPL